MNFMRRWMGHNNEKRAALGVHVKTLDGHFGKGSGVIVFRDGTILGGDALLCFTGRMRSDGIIPKGEMRGRPARPNPGTWRRCSAAGPWASAFPARSATESRS